MGSLIDPSYSTSSAARRVCATAFCSYETETWTSTPHNSRHGSVHNVFDLLQFKTFQEPPFDVKECNKRMQSRMWKDHKGPINDETLKFFIFWYPGQKRGIVLLLRCCASSTEHAQIFQGILLLKWRLKPQLNPRLDFKDLHIFSNDVKNFRGNDSFQRCQGWNGWVDAFTVISPGPDPIDFTGGHHLGPGLNSFVHRHMFLLPWWCNAPIYPICVYEMDLWNLSSCGQASSAPLEPWFSRPRRLELPCFTTPRVIPVTWQFSRLQAAAQVPPTAHPIKAAAPGPRMVSRVSRNEETPRACWILHFQQCFTRHIFEMVSLNHLCGTWQSSWKSKCRYTKIANLKPKQSLTHQSERKSEPPRRLPSASPDSTAKSPGAADCQLTQETVGSCGGSTRLEQLKQRCNHAPFTKNHKKCESSYTFVY